MTTIDTLLADLADVIDRASKLAGELATTWAEVVADAIDNLPTRTTTLTTMPVADVPVDGSVEVRPVGGAGRFGPWVHVIGEQQAVGGDENRSLLIDGVPEPFTWHLDQCVQVRPFRPVDEDLVEARHRARNGGL